MLSLRCKDKGGIPPCSRTPPDGRRRPTARRSRSRRCAVPEDLGRIAARTERHALSQRPQSAIRRARRALVRRRRHAARLPSRERPRLLSQPLGPHPEMAGRARRRPRAVRRLRPQAAGRARRTRPTAASPTPTSSSTPAACSRWRKAICRPRSSRARSTTRGYCNYGGAHRRRPSPRIRRSIRSPARWCSSATTPPAR